MEQPYVYDKAFRRHVPVEYAPDGEICRYYIFKDDIALAGAGYLSIIHDLTECEVSLTILKGMLNDPSVATVIKSSLYTSTVSLYIRCFNQAWGRSTNLDETIFDSYDKKFKEFHEEVKEMRNNFIGHAGKSKHESISLILYFHPTTEAVVTSKGAINKHQFGHGIELFMEMIGIAKQTANEKFNELKPDLEAFIRSQDMYRIFRRAKTPKEQDFI